MRAPQASKDETVGLLSYLKGAQLKDAISPLGSPNVPGVSFAPNAMTVSNAQRAIANMAGPMPPDPNEEKSNPPIDVEYGATGTAVIAGVLQSDEYNPDLQWRDGIRIWDQMRRSDATVRQTLAICEFPLTAAMWKIAPASPDPDHLEQASFIESALFHDLEQSWMTVLHQALLNRTFGFMLFEKVWKQRDDGMTVWQKFAPRLPRTIYRWWQNTDRSLYGVQQWVWEPAIQAFSFTNIPAGKLLRFTYQEEGDNWAGISMLRSAYNAWLTKQGYFNLQKVGFEREHVGVPVVQLPPSYSKGDALRAGQIGRNIRSNEQGYVVLPPEWTIEWLKTRNTSSKGSGILDAMRYLNLEIQNNALAGFLALGQSGTGSYAASNDQSMLFLKALQADAQYICDMFHLDAFPQLLAFNYPKVDMVPKLIVQALQAYDMKSVAQAIAQLVTAGAMRPTVEIEAFLYEFIGIPRPPANLIESTDPNHQAGNRLQPDETGLTPMPIPADELIALANRMSRDVEKTSVMKGTAQGENTANPNVGTDQDKGNTPSLDKVAASLGLKVIKGAQAAGQQGQMHEVYAAKLAEPTRPISVVQNLIFRRMAAQAVRPRIQLYGDYVFASAQLSEAAESGAKQVIIASRQARRDKLTAIETAKAQAEVDTLRDELLRHAVTVAALDAGVTQALAEQSEQSNELDNIRGMMEALAS